MMKKPGFWSMMVVAALLLAACSAAGGDAQSDANASGGAQIELTGTAWTLTALDGAAPAGEVTLSFEADGRAGGKSGCNNYGGGFTVDGERLHFGQMASTMMACDEALMQLEQDYLAALAQSQTFSATPDALTITTAAGTLTFARK